MLRLPLLFVLLGAGLVSAESLEFDRQDKVVYKTVGERELLADVFVPKAEGTYPGVLVVHGGGWRSGNRKQLRGYARALAGEGCVCFAIDYRLAPLDKFPAQIDDCRSAVKWIRTNADKYKVDPKRIGAIGYSAGGHLVSLLATTGKAPSDENGDVDTRLTAVVAGGAPTEFRELPAKGAWAEYWMGGTLETVPDKFKAASPTVFVDKDDPPIFFFNGTKDRIVPLRWSTPLYEALQKHGIKTAMHKIEDKNHFQAASNKEALAKAYDFLLKELAE